MLDFKEFYTVVTQRAARSTGVHFTDIPGRIYSSYTVRVDEFSPPGSGKVYVLEFDGECFWRVALTSEIAHDGRKCVAFVIGGVRYDQIRTPVEPMRAARVVNAMLNNQHKTYIAEKYSVNTTTRTWRAC